MITIGGVVLVIALLGGTILYTTHPSQTNTKTGNIQETNKKSTEKDSKVKKTAADTRSNSKETKKESAKESKKETANTNSKKVEKADASKKDTISSKEGKDKEVSVKESNKELKKETASADTKKSESTVSTPVSTNTSSKSDGKTGNESGMGSSKGETHTHNYNIPITKIVHHDATGHNEAVYTTVTDYEEQPIYTEKVVCGCGAVFDSDTQWEQHSIDGCVYGYSVKPIQSGTQKVAVGSHQEQTGTKWVQDSAAYDETVTVGYKCSCGATK